MQFARRDFLKLTGLGAAGVALGWRLNLAASLTNTLYLLAPQRSISNSLTAAFTESTGIQVVWRQTVEPLAATDFDSYDLVVVPAHELTPLIQQQAIRELDRLPASIILQQRAYDPFNAFSLPAARGAIGLNAQGFTPPTTWADFFELAKSEPTYLPCPDAHNAILKMMGQSINTRNTLARQRVGDVLSGLNSGPLENSRLAIGTARPGWNFVVPAEGAELWEDCFCIPANSPQPTLAQTFMRFAVEHQPLAPLPLARLEPRSAFAPTFSIF